MQFFERTEIETFSKLAEVGLSKAMEGARNRTKVSRGDQALTGNMASRYLPAVNHRARVIWGRALADAIGGKFCPDHGVNHNQPVYLVTLVHSDCATAISDTEPEVDRFKAHLRYGLRGCSYLGAIEPAYYSNVEVGIGATTRERRCIFWHLHVLLWGVTDHECRQLIKMLNRSGRYQPIVSEFKGAHRKLVQQGDLPAVVGYIFKPPGVAYRLWQTTAQKYDQPTFKMHQHTSPLRPGERVNLFCAMSGLYLDQLALAGGEGVSLLATAKKQALKVGGYNRLMSHERSEKRRRAGKER